MIRRVGNRPPTGSGAVRLTLSLRKYAPSRGKGEWQRYNGSKTATFELTGIVTLDDVMAKIETALMEDFKGEQ
jgi:hypothetical protein